MKKFELNETRIPNLFYTEMYQKSSIDIPEALVPKCYDSLFMAMARFCEMKKRKEDKKIAFIVRDLKDNFKLGMVVEYHEGTDEETDEKGNWSVVLTFDPEDVKGSTLQIYSTDSQFIGFLSNVTREMHGFQYSLATSVPAIIELLIELVIQWLNEEAKAGEEVVLELPGYFVAQVVVDGDKKVLGITPGENIKNVVKGDLSL